MGGIKIKLNKIAILSLLMMLLCFIGTASATEDINDTVVAESTLDDNSVSIDNVDDSNDDIQTIKNLDDDLASENSKISSTSGTPTTAYDWNTLKNKCEAPTSQYITLTGTTYTIGEVIKFKNSATIVGSNVSYITGGSTSKTPFLNINPALTLHFINVKFLNVNANNLLQLDGTVYLENCTFNNIQTATGRNSVIYNTNNLMYISGCNITNCNTGYGAVSNYVFGSTTSVVMYVDDCNFVNNSASVEPGAINNCGILYVNNTLFDGNHANWWAGAIHTHTNAQTEIQNSIFKRNTAGWNGGALYTYSKLKIYNSTFENNNCTTNNGGGAIGAYNYGSEYNITIDSCRFNYNKNLCEAYTNISTTSLGRGGAISVLNGGYLTVCNSNFTGNYARIGQAIAAATYTYENGTGGNPHIKICHNLFVNHTATGIDTVVITGNDYCFCNNVFINSYQATPYNETCICNSPKSSVKSLLRMSNDNVLTEWHNIIYVNASSPNDPESVDGQSWENAYGGKDSLLRAFRDILNNGVIYVADGEYTAEDYNYFPLECSRNITVIGLGSKVILKLPLESGAAGVTNVTHKFVNLTIAAGTSIDTGININSTFINCTFTAPMRFGNETKYYSTTMDPRMFLEYGYAKTNSMTFNNCIFKDIDANNVVNLYKYYAVNLNNCIFENITADSLVYREGTGYFEDDGIYFKNCTFTNSKFNGVVDSAANFDDAIAIEDCTYDSAVAIGTTEINGHFYVNATKLKVTAVDTNLTVKIADITYGNGFTIDVTLLNNVSGNVTVNINNKNYSITVVNGSGSLKVSDILDASNYIAVANFVGDNVTTYSSTANTTFTVAKATPTITISGGSKIYNVAKTLTITLANPISGTVSVIIGSQKVNVKVTNGKGTVSVNNLKPGNYNVKVIFASTSNYNETFKTAKLTVKKATPKMNAKKVTFKAKKKTKKYSIVLKTNENKALSKVKVTIKLGKKTYSAKTNSKGQATFKLTKLTKKGSYKATVKFAGNAYYQALSKKVTIKVKK